MIETAQPAAVNGQAGDPDDRPPYAIASVDNALRLLEMLNREDTLGVRDAAARLHVAPSTAHRLLAMLCYRGFAVKDDEHLYRVGPALGRRDAGRTAENDLCTVARPFLERLQREFNETVHLMVLRQTNVEFVCSIECNRSLRVSSRTGAIMSAHRTSGGQVLLAELSVPELSQLFPSGSPEPWDEWEQFTRYLAAIRRRGYGINDGLTERGIIAIGACVHGPDGRPRAALCLSAPTLRLSRSQIPAAADVLRQQVGKFEAELACREQPPGPTPLAAS